MKTIFDFKKAGEKLRKNWTRPYLLVGCPFRETARAILWACGVRSAGASDALSLVGIAVLGLGPLALVIWLGWWWWLLAWPLIVFLGYGPLDGYGERLHGDPLAEGGDLYGDPPPKVPKTAEQLAVEAEAKRLAAEAAARKKAEKAAEKAKAKRVAAQVKEAEREDKAGEKAEAKLRRDAAKRLKGELKAARKAAKKAQRGGE